MPDPGPALMDDAVVLDHVRELGETCSRAFKLFAVAERAGGSMRDTEAWAALTSLVDFVVREELPVNAATLGAFEQLIAAQGVSTGAAFASFKAVLEGAYPSRRAMSLAMSEFPKWVLRTSVELRGEVTSLLPVLAPSMNDLGNEGVTAICDQVTALDSPADRNRLTELLRSYAGSSADALSGLARLGRIAIQKDATDFDARLVQAASPESVSSSRDGERLFSASADALDAAETSERGLSIATLDFLLELSGRSVSSAYAVAKALPGILGSLGPEAARRYLEDFRTLAATLNVRVVGFGLGSLATMYRADPAAAHDFVEIVARVGRRYGVTAGMWFAERRTESAQRAHRRR